MCDEVIRYLNIRDGGTYIDATFGQGGYSKNILENNNCTIIAIDRDKESKKFAQNLKKQFTDRFLFKTDRFSNLDNTLKYFNKKKVDGIAFDLGISNTQIDSSERGFSFSKNGPLDMRMGTQVKKELTAEIIINEFSEEEISNIFYKYGEVKNSRKISNQIVKLRKIKKIISTKELSKIVNDSCLNNKKKIDGSTKVFQALRIFINGELDELKVGLDKCLPFLKKESRIVVVSFHSLEDRIVKNMFRKNSGYTSQNYKHLPEKDNQFNFEETLKIITKKIIRPSAHEVKKNPRSRSAKIRVAEKV